MDTLDRERNFEEGRMKENREKTGKRPLSEEPEMKRLREMIERGKVKASRLTEYIREEMKDDDGREHRSTD